MGRGWRVSDVCVCDVFVVCVLGDSLEVGRGECDRGRQCTPRDV